MLRSLSYCIVGIRYISITYTIIIISNFTNIATVCKIEYMQTVCMRFEAELNARIHNIYKLSTFQYLSLSRI